MESKSHVLKVGGLLVVLTLAVFWLFVLRESDLTQVRVESLTDLETELDALRERLKIPGMSAAIAERDRIVWSRGFGMADEAQRAPATPETIYHLGSVTKPYASTVLLQLVEEGRLDLNAPVSDFGITMPRSAPVRVWHLLSHTSDEPPGTRYRYDSDAFGRLTQVIERAAGRPFATVLADRLIRPLGLSQTAPSPGDLRGFRSLLSSFEPSPEEVERERGVFAASGIERAPIEAALAKGYARAWGRSIWPAGLFGPMREMSHGMTLSAAGGLVASATDVARFSIALDQGGLLAEGTRKEAWTPLRTERGRTSRYALGWFVQQHRGYDLVWHYGQTLEASSLLVKIRGHQVTFVILANSDGLSRWRRLGDRADISASPAATLFLNWHSSRAGKAPR